MVGIKIREISAQDNAFLEVIIKSVILEHGLPKDGTAYSDPETLQMYQAYQGEKEVYFVVDVDGIVKGGAGIKPLRDYETDVCELQKMYFLSELRGRGVGKKLLTHCLEAARQLGFKSCYLETTPKLNSAIKLYESFGFKHLEKSLGNTGHYSCGIWMELAL